MEDVDRPAERVEVRPGRVGEPLDVAEPDDGRVGDVDVGVGEPVEDEGPPVHVVAVGHDRDAVVGALRVARRGTGERETTHDERGDAPGPRPGSRRRPAGPRVSASPIDDEQTADRDDQRAVGTRPSSTKPVTNVPVIAPTVPIADSRPTIEPLVATSVSVARTIIGPTADRIAAGATKARVARATIATKPSPRPTAPTRADDRDGGDRRQATEHERRAEQRPRSEGVRRPTAEPCTERDAGQDRPDDPGVRRQRDADVGSEEPAGRDLEHEHAGRGEERQGRSEWPRQRSIGAVGDHRGMVIEDGPIGPLRVRAGRAAAPQRASARAAPD